MTSIETAKIIVASGDNITYPSGAAARHIRQTMRCLLESLDWHDAAAAPHDGTHILVCKGPYGQHWGFNQSPPCVVHYFPDPDAPGFYLSGGIVQDSYNDKPVEFTHWRHLGEPPGGVF
jgi:hypothetical protein